MSDMEPRAPGPSGTVTEAILLPLLLLSVALLGGVRIAPDGRLTFVAPPLFALVLGALLAGLMARAGLLAPRRLLGAGRGLLANLNGLVALVALLFATAQVFTMLTPEAGLAAFAFDVLFAMLLLSTWAAAPDAARLGRSLAVMLGSALVLRFVVLNGLVAPGGSLARRLLAVALEGVTLGALGVEYAAPAAGYLAFATLALFFAAVALLPRD